MKTRYDLDKDIEYAEQQIKALAQHIEQMKEERQAVHELTAEQQLAEHLHSRLCHANHTDQCGWGYETWQHWEQRDALHKDKYDPYTEYYNRAVMLLAIKHINHTLDQWFHIIDVITGRIK